MSPGESVQAAIDAADSGSVIVLRGGSYNESINLNKSNITIKAAKNISEADFAAFVEKAEAMIYSMIY